MWLRPRLPGAAISRNIRPTGTAAHPRVVRGSAAGASASSGTARHPDTPGRSAVSCALCASL
eukprot:12641048-Alexandrium_andersonii.AAC.1